MQVSYMWDGDVHEYLVLAFVEPLPNFVQIHGEVLGTLKHECEAYWDLELHQA